MNKQTLQFIVTISSVLTLVAVVYIGSVLIEYEKQLVETVSLFCHP